MCPKRESNPQTEVLNFESSAFTNFAIGAISIDRGIATLPHCSMRAQHPRSYLSYDSVADVSDEPETLVGIASS